VARARAIASAGEPEWQRHGSLRAAPTASRTDYRNGDTTTVSYCSGTSTFDDFLGFTSTSPKYTELIQPTSNAC